MTRRRAAAALMAALWFGGCGSADDTSESATTAALATTAGSNVGVVGVDGAVLGPPEEGAPERFADPENGCEALGADVGTTVVACAVAGEYTAVVEQAGVGLLAWVFEHSGEARSPVLFSADPSVWAAVGLVDDDLDGDGVTDFVFGFRTSGTGGFLSVDIVSGATGTVAGHLDSLHKGAAAVGGGALDVYAAVFGPDEPECCPTSFQHQSIRGSGGNYVITAEETVPTEDVPESQL